MEDLKHELIAVCRELEHKSYFVGTYGNLSARVPEGLLITPSRVAYSALKVEDMVTISLEGQVIEGNRLPSSELEVHRQIYLCRSDVGAIVHTHSLGATALSCLHQMIPVIVEELSQVIGDEVRCTRYVPAGKHRELGLQVATTLGKSNGVLLANHGAVACGRSLAEAVLAAQILERAAQMKLSTSLLGGPVPIPREFVESERERWLYKYGSAADGVIPG